MEARRHRNEDKGSKALKDLNILEETIEDNNLINLNVENRT